MTGCDGLNVTERTSAVAATAVLVLSLVAVGALLTGVAAQKQPPEGPLTTEATPGEAGVENEFTFAFNASEISDERDVQEIRIDFDEASGVDAAAITEDDITIEGQDTGTPSVDATTEEAPGVLLVTASDTFTLANEGGLLNVTVSGVTVPNEGTFDSSIEFLDAEESDVIAVGNDQYEIGETSSDPASFAVTIQGTNSPVSEGESLQVDAEIENTGDESGSQTVDLSVDGLGSDQASVSLDGGASTVETFSVDTAEGDAGTYTATVSSEDSSDSTSVEVQAGTSEGPLTTEATPGEAGVENEFTFAFNASEISDERSVLEIRLNFDEASGVDTAAIAEDDVTIQGESTGTPGVDATTEEAPGVLLVTASDTFTLDNEGGLLNVTVSGVTVPNEGTFDSEIAFLDDEEGATIAVGSDDYTVDEGEADGPPPVVGDNPPRDLNGDGLYRDTDGNGEFSIGDVQIFFQNRDADAVRNNPEFFNFDGGQSPDVSVGDVQALFMDFVDGE
ncbi:hypothetical protein BRC61_03550 [Halobacteriales archaeon QH_10_65_19]|nr:MAG: hypothetical protein BRC61_03550 [Halobacteriales archaeon QH_10_65_19]